MAAMRDVHVDLWFNDETCPVVASAKVQWFPKANWPAEPPHRDQCITLSLDRLSITMFRASPADLTDLIAVLSQALAEVQAGPPREREKGGKS